MKSFLLGTFLTLFSLIQNSVYGQEMCKYPQNDDAVSDLLLDLDKIGDTMFTRVMGLKVNMDGNGGLSVFFDKDGTPKLLKLKYKSTRGKEMQKVLTFKELAQGKTLDYENRDFPGKAIIVGRGDPFKKDGEYQFKVRFRSKVDPDTYNTYTINFSGCVDSPVVKYNNKKFSAMIVSPGVSFFSWDGTFKQVEFK